MFSSTGDTISLADEISQVLYSLRRRRLISIGVKPSDVYNGDPYTRKTASS